MEAPTDFKVHALRKSFQNIDAYLIPRHDIFQGEYVPPSAERLAYISGFTGSAGCAVVSREEALLFVDGRYTLQAYEEVDLKFWKIFPIDDFVKTLAQRLDRKIIGVDAWLISHKRYEFLQKQKIFMHPFSPNLVDLIWQNRPKDSIFQAFPWESGRNLEDSLDVLWQSVPVEANAVLIFSPECVNNLFSLRGGDIPFTPLCHVVALLTRKGEVHFFSNDEKIPSTLFSEVHRHDLSTLSEFLKTCDSVAGDLSEIPYALSVTHPFTNPLPLLFSQKNATELSGCRQAHVKDGLAWIRFLARLENEYRNDSLDECSAADILEEERNKIEGYRGPSFSTISAVGPHGAIVHYRANPKSASPLRPDQLYLVDAGAQFLDGTTDATRTLILGEPTNAMCHHYTLVLKGHLALARQKFPKGTSGAQLDILARQYLWQNGLDYAHGTGHGVGSFLGVHDGPQRISRLGNIPLEHGMVLSNEPGYYREGFYGIRLENLMCVWAEDENWLGFKVLTLIPWEKRLINTNELSPIDIDDINRYHACIWKVFEEQCSENDWLKNATSPIVV